MIIEDGTDNDGRSAAILQRANEIIDEMWGRMILELEKELEDEPQITEGVILPAYLTAATHIKSRIEKLVADLGGHTWSESDRLVE